MEKNILIGMLSALLIVLLVDGGFKEYRLATAMKGLAMSGSVLQVLSDELDRRDKCGGMEL